VEVRNKKEAEETTAPPAMTPLMNLRLEIDFGVSPKILRFELSDMFQNHARDLPRPGARV